MTYAAELANRLTQESVLCRVDDKTLIYPSTQDPKPHRCAQARGATQAADAARNRMKLPAAKSFRPRSSHRRSRRRPRSVLQRSSLRIQKRDPADARLAGRRKAMPRAGFASADHRRPEGLQNCLCQACGATAASNSRTADRSTLDPRQPRHERTRRRTLTKRNGISLTLSIPKRLRTKPASCCAECGWVPTNICGPPSNDWH